MIKDQNEQENINIGTSESCITCDACASLEEGCSPEGLSEESPCSVSENQAEEVDTDTKNKAVKRAFLGILTFILLLVMQILFGKAGTYISNLIPYQQIDPFDTFMGLTVHHTVMGLLGLLLILVLCKILHHNFYFQLGNTKKGLEAVLIYAAVFLVLAVGLQAFNVLNNQPSTYAFPLDARNVIGTLGFQLLLSGPAEEILYRALPIIILELAFGKSIRLIKGGFTLEVMLASLLFAFGHVSWSLVPFNIQADYFQLGYAFVLGTIQGIVYQRTKSILYPMLMHSFSNVLMVGVGYIFSAIFA